jgi:hypothetical protein
MLTECDLGQVTAISARPAWRAIAGLVGLAAMAGFAFAEPAASPESRSDANGALLGEAESSYRQHEAQSFLQRLGPGRGVPVSLPPVATAHSPAALPAVIAPPAPSRPGRVEITAVPAGPPLAAAREPRPIAGAAGSSVSGRVVPPAAVATPAAPGPSPSVLAPVDLAVVQGAKPAIATLVPRRAPPGLVVAREIDPPSAVGPPPVTAEPPGPGAAAIPPPPQPLPAPARRASSAAAGDVGDVSRSPPAPPAKHALSREECRDVIARAQLGEASGEELAALRTSCH